MNPRIRGLHHMAEERLRILRRLLALLDEHGLLEPRSQLLDSRLQVLAQDQRLSQLHRLFTSFVCLGGGSAAGAGGGGSPRNRARVVTGPQGYIENRENAYEVR